MSAARTLTPWCSTRANLLARFKSLTTLDVTTGIRDALRGLVAAAPALDLARIRYAMLGTTHCTNAVIERRNLNRVGLIRIGAPSTLAIPPFVDWPEDLRAVLGAELPITYSHEIGSVGLLERENAAILNAALVSAATVAADGFRQALAEHGIAARLFFSQNDGTLMALDYAIRYPILTVASGPTNSIRGAAFLSGLQDAIVVDVGGTSTDVGVLVKGFPRESAVAVDVGGVRTNIRSPDLLSIAVGGGTRIGADLTIGPQSVGYRRTSKARVVNLDPALVTQITDRVRALCEDAIDRVKTSAAPMPIILVDGGSVVIPQDLAGASTIIRPANYDVANAIGAAIAQCSGEIERVFSLAEMSRDVALELAKQLAIEEAIKAGADPATVQIIDIQEVPLAYLPTNSATRIRVRAAGDLAIG